MMFVTQLCLNIKIIQIDRKKVNQLHRKKKWANAIKQAFHRRGNMIESCLIPLQNREGKYKLQSEENTILYILDMQNKTLTNQGQIRMQTKRNLHIAGGVKIGTTLENYLKLII